MVTVFVVVFSLRNLAELVVVVVGVAVAGAGGWWLITERPPRRWVGLGGAVVGVVVVVAAVWSAADGDRPLVRALVVLVLFAVTIGSARAWRWSGTCTPKMPSSRMPWRVPVIRC